MNSNIYVLLVGIDDYLPPVPRLRGCVNDVEAASALLTTRAAAAGDTLHLRVLTDRKATRETVITVFREHLGQAKDGDSAVFWYSGHGAQELAPPEHWKLEPDHLNETLVLFDSRQPGIYDLADKELAQLVADITDHSAHMLVVLDCCHSGSGVRAVADSGETVRRAPPDDRRRPLASYLNLTADITAAPSGERADWLNLTPASRYVLLAACRSDQSAKEVRVDGTPRGVLSIALERALARTAGSVSYRELHAWVAATVRTLADDQTPILEAPHVGDITQPFLGGAVSPVTPILTASHRPGRGWVLDAGLVYGIPAPAAATTQTELTLHPLTGSGNADGPTCARGRVVAVTAATATLSVTPSGPPLDESATYRAVLRALPVARTRAAVTGDEGAAAVRTLLEASTLVEVVDMSDVDASSLVVACAASVAHITRGRGDRALIANQPLVGRDGPADTARAVERIARWQTIRDRGNPLTRLPAVATDFTAFDAEGAHLPVAAGGVECVYTADANGDLVQPTIRVRVRNGSPRRLYYAVVALSELFGVASLIPGGGVWLNAGEDAWLLGDDGQPELYLSVPDGQERATDTLKLIVSTEEFDARQFDQGDLRPPTPTRGPDLGADRGIGGSPELPAAAEDWTTRELLVTTVRSQAGVALAPDASRPLAPGVVIQPHPRLRATARLLTRPAATRDAVVPLLPPLLSDLSEVSEPFSFSGTRSAGEELSILQLEDVEAPESVTPQEPLLITVARPLVPGEHVLVLGSDGEDHLPLGVGRATADGQVELRLTRLPQPTAAGTRSLGGSLKLLFRKLVLRRLGAGYPYPMLSLVRYDAEGAPEPVHDQAAIRAAIMGASRILLLVHGIIGDTRGMTQAIGVRPNPLHAGYDAVLAFDYENLHTGIDDTAGLLRSQLADAGLGSGTRLDIVAHSMGGLVSRWYVEHCGGAAFVDRLVMCGTPHGGSPWPRVEDLAISALAFGLNRLVDLSGAPGVAAMLVGFLVQGVERVDVTLDQMAPGSPILTALAESGDPGVRYVGIAGDHPFGSVANPGRIASLLQKLRVPGAVLNTLFDGRPHDLAVSVESATAVGGAWSMPPGVIDADCSHLSYFSSREGLAAIRAALE